MPNTSVPLISLNEHPIKDANVWPIVSPDYSATSAYALNSHVVYDNQLYRCVVAIALPGEEWNSNHWEQTTVDEELRRGLNQGADALHVVAAPYNSSVSYAIGSYTLKDGLFYRCVTEIQNGETWTPSHWVEVTVGSELNSKQTELDTLEGMIIPEYDNEVAYSKNDYVSRNGIMYRALEDIAGLDPWDATKWEMCTVGSELGNSRNMDKFTRDSIAPEYRADRTYSSGELVMYNGKLYRCQTTLTSPEPFNAAKWVITSVANEVSMTDISAVLGFYIDEEGYLTQNVTSDGVDPSTVNLDEVLGFYISADGYISQKVTV